MYYEYRADGPSQRHPTFIVRRLAGHGSIPAEFYGNALKYNQQGELWSVTQIHWSETDLACNELVRERILEFRGSGRARYLTRQRDPTVENGQSREQVVLPGTTRWSDYDGDTIYGDYVVDPETGSVVNQTAYLPGIGQMDNVSGAVTYYHADHLGTLRATTDGSGAFAGAMAYTAFGEMVAADGSIGGEGLSGSRYQYAGDWGYESGLLPAVDGGSGNSIPGLSWQHVGHRWYDPSTGRFLQRDPIGIKGGLTVYEYVTGSPVMSVDPAGLTSPTNRAWDWSGFTKDSIGGGLVGFVGGMNSGPALPIVTGLGVCAGAVYYTYDWTWDCVEDILYYNSDAKAQEEANRIQRAQNPIVFPPPPIIVNAPDVCGKCGKTLAWGECHLHRP